MKIVCSKADLMSGINIVLKAVPAKTTLPVLECILIKAENSAIKFMSNDMELGIETIVKGDIVESGNIAINAKIFADIVRKLPENDVTIETDTALNTKITCEKSKFNIAAKDGAEFPALPIIEKNTKVTLSQFTLREVIRQTVFSISDNDANKIMTGELFEVNGNKMRFAALDGHRIAVRNVTLKDDYGKHRIIVPGKALNEIGKIINGEVEDEVNIYITDKHVMFEMTDTIILSRLIEGDFYHLDTMINGEFETKLTVNNKQLLSSIDRAILLVKESDKKPVVIGITDDTLDLKMKTQIGSMNDEIAVDKEGKDIIIGFNPKFLIEALRVIDDEMIDLYFINPKAPLFIKDKNGEYVYLILPVNINTQQE